MIATVVLAVAGGLALLLLRGLYEQTAANRTWSFALTPAAERQVTHLRERLDDERVAAELAFEGADGRRNAGEYSEALRLFGVGYHYLEQVTGDRLELLRRLAVYSRIVSAIVPLPPLSPARFRLREVRTMAALAGAMHHVLVTSAERFQLRCAVTGMGFRAVLRALVRSRRRLEARPQGPAWMSAIAARQDFDSLSDETLESFRALVVSMVAEPRAALASQPR